MTIFGVIIGVAFVVTTMVVGSSSVAWLNSQAFGKGSNLILLSTGTVSSNGNYNISPNPVFGNNTVLAVKSVSGVNKVYPAGVAMSFTLVRNGARYVVSEPIIFVDPAILDVIGVHFLAGSSDVGGIILSNDTAHLLNATLGSKLTISVSGNSNPESYAVTGIFIPPTSSLGAILAQSAYLPLSAWHQPYSEIYVEASGANDIASVQSNALAVARSTTIVSTLGQSVVAFSLQTLASGAVSTNGTLMNFFLFAGILALVIGGIGVTNVMLMSLKERIREIGILKAIGTSDASVLAVYLTESAFVGLIGGLLGLGIGLVVSVSVLNNLLAIPFSPSLLSIIIGPTVGAAIGIVFGAYPALKAYRMSPGEAVRWEW